MTDAHRQDAGLLACPFCGSAAKAQMYSNNDLFKVECTRCTAQISGFDQSKQDAIDAWNTRATPASCDGAEGTGEWKKDIDLIRTTLDRAGMATRSHIVPSQVTHALHRIEAALATPPNPAPDALREDSDLDPPTPPVEDLPLYWQGWANALRLMDGKRTESDPASLAQATAYEKCANELQAALSPAPADGVRTAPENCPHCFDDSDCSQIDLCRALAGMPAPLPAVAAEAEQFGWRWRDALLAGSPDWHIGLSPPQGFKNSKRWIVEPLHASPPLRGEREALVPPVERIECVKGFFPEEPADPVWRIEISGICADFSTETAANNFRNAILSLQSSPAALSPTSGASTGGGK